MALLRAKQIHFQSEDQLIIGSNNNAGRYLDVGLEGDILKITDTGIEWSYVDVIRNATSTNTVTASDAGVSFGLGDATLVSSSDVDGNVSLTVTNENGDLVLVPGEGGSVVIGSAGDGVIEVDANENLSVKGGSGTGNLFLTAGAKVYYAADDTDPSREVATLGDLAGAAVVYGRNDYAGNAVSFDIPADAVATSVIAYINGVVVERTFWSIVSNAIVFDTDALGFTLDLNDLVTATYSRSA